VASFNDGEFAVVSGGKRTLLGLSGRGQRFSLLDVVVMLLVDSSKWQFTPWVAGGGLFTFLKVMRVGVGVNLFLSWVRSEIFSKSRMGMVSLASVPERLRRAGDDDNEGHVPFVPVGSLGKNGVSSFVGVLRRGDKCPEVEKKLSQPVAPLGEKRRDH
jgi:hypothetical protein